VLSLLVVLGAIYASWSGRSRIADGIPQRSELLLATFREHGGSFDCALSKLPLMANSVTVRFPFALLRVRVAGADQWVRCYINLLN
jgi:hypothetical protein